MRASRKPPAKITPRKNVFTHAMAGIEGYRRLRADGTPNWAQRLPEKIGEAGLIASRPPIMVSSTAPIMEAIEAITRNRVRGLIVSSGPLIHGVVTANDLVNYLGGGSYYNVALERHGGNIYRALTREKVATISSTRFPVIGSNEPLSRAVELILASRAGFLIVVNNGKPYGVLTERDLIRHLSGKRVGISVEQAMTTPVFYVEERDTMKKAAELLTRYGIRRLPVVSSSGEVEGILTARSYLEYYGSHKVFSELGDTSLEKVLGKPISTLDLEEAMYAETGMDVGDAVDVMVKTGTSSLLVVDDEYNVVGILTERDALIAMLA
ncbi:MAG: CBS domain-containing protein [Desulfurococcales archaeon]|nr:CBS domain-containing protein [Desulfurococcales archaeon]